MKKKKSCVGNNGKGMLKLPFHCPYSILGEALEWQFGCPLSPGACGFAHPEPIGTPLEQFHVKKFVQNTDLNKTSHFRVAFLESNCKAALLNY